MYISITCTASVSAVAEIKRLYALHYSLVYILWSFLIIPRGCVCVCVCGGGGGWGGGDEGKPIPKFIQGIQGSLMNHYVSKGIRTYGLYNVCSPFCGSATWLHASSDRCTNQEQHANLKYFHFAQ